MSSESMSIEDAINAVYDEHDNIESMSIAYRNTVNPRDKNVLLLAAALQLYTTTGKPVHSEPYIAHLWQSLS